MFTFLESLIRGTRTPDPKAPPPGLLAFYWHFVSQTKGPYLAMVLSSFCVALADMGIPVIIGQLVLLMQAPDRAAAFSAHSGRLRAWRGGV